MQNQKAYDDKLLIQLAGLNYFKSKSKFWRFINIFKGWLKIFPDNS